MEGGGVGRLTRSRAISASSKRAAKPAMARASVAAAEEAAAAAAPALARAAAASASAPRHVSVRRSRAASSRLRGYLSSLPRHGQSGCPCCNAALLNQSLPHV